MEEPKIFVLYILDDNIFLRIRDGKFVTDSSIIGEGPLFDNCARCILNCSDLKVDKFFRVHTIGKVFGYIALLNESERNRDCWLPCWRSSISYESIPIDVLGQYKILEDKETIISILDTYKDGNSHEISLERSKELW